MTEEQKKLIEAVALLQKAQVLIKNYMRIKDEQTLNGQQYKTSFFEVHRSMVDVLKKIDNFEKSLNEFEWYDGSNNERSA